MTLKTNVTHTYSQLLIQDTACDKLARKLFAKPILELLEEKELSFYNMHNNGLPMSVLRIFVHTMCDWLLTPKPIKSDVGVLLCESNSRLWGGKGFFIDLRIYLWALWMFFCCLLYVIVSWQEKTLRQFSRDCLWWWMKTRVVSREREYYTEQNSNCIFWSTKY